MLKKELFEVISCPSCEESAFDVFDLPDEGEFRECGAIVCKGCQALYSYQNQILSLLAPELADADREIKLLDHYETSLPAAARARKEVILQQAKKGTDETWKIAEKEFWDHKKYGRQISRNRRHAYEYNRFEVRKKHLTDPIRHEIEGKFVLEVGAGNSATLYYILNPEKYHYHLFVTELSYNGLLLARQLHPTGYFIQCDATQLPFREQAFDVIFEFALLHHLPDNINALERHIDFLKPGGYLGTHDSTNRRGAFLAGMRFFKKYQLEQSEHNEFVDEKAAIAMLEKKGTIVHKHIEYSPVRNWLINFSDRFIGLNNAFFHFAFVTIDQLIIRTIGRIWNKMDGNILIVLWKKS